MILHETITGALNMVHKRATVNRSLMPDDWIGKHNYNSNERKRSKLYASYPQFILIYQCLT